MLLGRLSRVQPGNKFKQPKIQLSKWFYMYLNFVVVVVLIMESLYFPQSTQDLFRRQPANETVIGV